MTGRTTRTQRVTISDGRHGPRGCRGPALSRRTILRHPDANNVCGARGVLWKPQQELYFVQR